MLILNEQGTQDRTVNYKYANKILEILPADTRRQSQLVTIDGGPHDLTISHSGAVVHHLLAFFEGPRPTLTA